jgi:hypothetical protein
MSPDPPATCLPSAVIYQFIPVAAGRVMQRLIRSMAPGTMAILDLENGYLDVRDQSQTSERREGGRTTYGLIAICPYVDRGLAGRWGTSQNILTFSRMLECALRERGGVRTPEGACGGDHLKG